MIFFRQIALSVLAAAVAGAGTIAQATAQSSNPQCMKKDLVAKQAVQLGKIESIRIENDAELVRHHDALREYDRIATFQWRAPKGWKPPPRGTPYVMPSGVPVPYEACDTLERMQRMPGLMNNFLRDQLAELDEWAYFTSRRRECASIFHDARKMILTRAWAGGYGLSDLEGLDIDVTKTLELEKRIEQGLADEGLKDAKSWSYDDAREKAKSYGAAFAKMSYRCEAAYLNLINPAEQIPESQKTPAPKKTR